MEDLIIKYLQKKTDLNERERLFKWIAENQKNELQFIRLKKTFSLTRGIDHADENAAWKIIRKRVFLNRKVKQVSISMLKYAAIFILSFIVFTQFDFSRKPETDLEYHYVTAEGNQINFITLSDGSKIWLNPGSKLQIPTNFSLENRQVHLQGQGYFEIVHNDANPFLVHMNEEKIRVLGTRFNVNAYHSDYLEVTLINGKIQLFSKQQHISELIPGEKLTFNYKNQTIEREWLENTDFYSSWKSGNLHFENIRLTSILELLEKWYSVEFRLNQPEIGDIPFTGTLLKEEGLDQVLKLISSSSKLKYRKSKPANKQLVEFYLNY
jgi:transmembrane sensor